MHFPWTAVFSPCCIVFLPIQFQYTNPNPRLHSGHKMSDGGLLKKTSTPHFEKFEASSMQDILRPKISQSTGVSRLPQAKTLAYLKSAEKGHYLPPCKVCKGTATGFHYGMHFQPSPPRCRSEHRFFLIYSIDWTGLYLLSLRCQYMWSL